MTTIKEYTTDELLLIAHNVTCEYSPQKVRRAKRELYARGVTDKVIADIMEEEEVAFNRRLEAAARAEQKREDERNEKNRRVSYPHPQMACLFFFAPFVFVFSIKRFNFFTELRRLKAEKYDLMFKQRLWLLIGGDLAWGVWVLYQYFWVGRIVRMEKSFLHIIFRLMLIVAACPIDASALVLTDSTIYNEYNQKNGIATETERDRFGRETHKSIRANNIEKGKCRYQWGIANRLLSKENELTGVTTRYDYDQFDFLIREENYQSETHLDTIYRMPDRIGNLYGTPDKKDRKYGAGGRLEEDEEHFYHYDDEGNLIYKELRTLQDGIVNYNRKEEEQELNIKFRSTGTGWRYDWQSNGMLKRVIRPDEKAVHFRYDALGRRTAKVFKGTVTRWIWDGNVPLHEWEYKAKLLQAPLVEGDKQQPTVEPTEDITTWVFEAGTFVPTAKIKGDKRYSIVTDYLGTPIQMYDEQGEKTWDCTLDVYGKVANFEGSSLKDVPFRYQGQYEDEETGLYYNRFRFYDSSTGIYLSQDPIGLAGNNPTLYTYVYDPNNWLDPFGLTAEVYKLVVTKSSYYDVYEWGSDSPVGKTWLNEGDTWKIGETADFRTKKDGTEIQNRYSKKWLTQNNLEYKPLQHSPNKSAKSSFQVFETSRIKKFEKQFGNKPAGNKCCH